MLLSIVKKKEMVVPTISCCIPAYREELLINKTVTKLMQQTAWKQLDLEIVISDYDPDGTELTRKALGKLLDYGDIRYFRCPYRGIGAGRNFGIQNARGNFIVNFDADSYYNRVDAIDRMVAPLRAGTAEWSMCEVIFDEGEMSADRPDNIGFRALVAAGRLSPLAIGWTECGLAQTRFSFDYVGGFSDFGSLQTHGLEITSKLSYAFTPSMRQWVPEVKVISSARRLKYQNLLGIGGLLGALNYENAFRGDNVVRVP